MAKSSAPGLTYKQQKTALTELARLYRAGGVEGWRTSGANLLELECVETELEILERRRKGKPIGDLGERLRRIQSKSRRAFRLEVAETQASMEREMARDILVREALRANLPRPRGRPRKWSDDQIREASRAPGDRRSQAEVLFKAADLRRADVDRARNIIKYRSKKLPPN